jgi:hypothetical protein
MKQTPKLAVVERLPTIAILGANNDVCQLQ